MSCCIFLGGTISEFSISIASSFELRSLLAVLDLFLASDWDFLGEIGKKGGYFGLGMGPFLGPLVIDRNGPDILFFSMKQIIFRVGG